MPLYEYQCRKCRHRFEVIQQFKDRPITRCPKCHTGRVEKLISAPAVHFKGTGWYVTDYGGKKASDKAGEKAEQGEKAEKGAKSESGDKGAKGSKPDGAKKSSKKD